MASSNYTGKRTRKINPARQMREVDHKNLALLRRYVSEFGQIQPRKYVGNTLVTQRVISQAVKRARHLALLPFVKH